MASPMTVTIPKEYGYVLLTAFSTTLIGYYHVVAVGQARGKAKVPYPNAYASREEIEKDQDKYVFNCAQRAHSNFLEHYPSFLVGLLGSGLRYPVVASALGAIWGGFRLAYFWGYTRRDQTGGKGRRAGRGYEFAEFGLVLLSAWTGLQMLLN